MTALPATTQTRRNLSRDSLRMAFDVIPWKVQGRVLDVTGTIIRAHAPDCRVGSLVTIDVAVGGNRAFGAAAAGRTEAIVAEVVGIQEDKALLMPYSGIQGVSAGCAVSVLGSADHLFLDESLLGRVVDPFLKPLIGDPLKFDEFARKVPIERAAPNPMERSRVSRTLSMGVRAIDSTLTFGEGQRIGIMAGSGVGKSVLMGMMARGSSADINVIGLIGERGREVREFLERDLGPEGLARSVVVVVTGDQSPLMRVRAAKVTTAIAEYFSSLGKNVLLMMDSLTRVAMAQREIGLAGGETPTTKGYPPSVFAMLPRLLERTGPQKQGCGPITALYTVLVDGDDFNDPIADAARAILDGHINLSRSLAARGHFPAIDITTSTSRVMYDIVSKQHWAMSSRLRTLLGSYQENFDLVQIGAYQQGANPVLDEALRKMPAIDRFLRQEINDLTPIAQTLELLPQLTGNPS